MKAASKSTGSVDRMFRAFSDPTRLRILNLLHGGEMCVGDLVKVLKVPQPTASRHLAYLRHAGLARARREGLWCYYSLAPVVGEFHRKLVECVSCCFGEVPALRADAARRAKLKAAGGCCPAREGGRGRGK